MTKESRNEFGRWQMRVDFETDTVCLYIENVNREGEHWLTLGMLESFNPKGYLRLRPISPGTHVFEVVEVRPAIGPLPHLPGESSDPEAPAPEESE